VAEDIEFADGQVRHHAGTGIRVSAVGVARFRPGSGLDQHLDSQRDQLARCLRRCRDPALALAQLAPYSYLHARLLFLALRRGESGPWTVPNECAAVLH
jgi:hypothetical protein